MWLLAFHRFIMILNIFTILSGFLILISFGLILKQEKTSFGLLSLLLLLLLIRILLDFSKLIPLGKLAFIINFIKLDMH